MSSAIIAVTLLALAIILMLLSQNFTMIVEIAVISAIMCSVIGLSYCVTIVLFFMNRLKSAVFNWLKRIRVCLARNQKQKGA